MVFNVTSLCTGVGIFDLAFVLRGARIVAQSEIDAFCRDILQLRAPQFWPDAQLFGDLIDEKIEWPDTDVIVAGFPCQPHSFSGSRRGVNDARWIWTDIARIIAAKRPRGILLENVAGFPTSSDGAAFRHVLRDLAACGYNAEWAVIDANAAVGAPHLRARWWCIAWRGDVANTTSNRRKVEKSPPHTNTYKNSTRYLSGNSAKAQRYNSTSTYVSVVCQNRRQHIGRTQSAMGGGVDGATNWLDRPELYPHWPVRMGEPQPTHEPARRVPVTNATHWQQVRALGNGVVFPQALLMVDALLERLRRKTSP
jgi:DNA-cytosine methyltransferase